MNMINFGDDIKILYAIEINSMEYEMNIKSEVLKIVVYHDSIIITNFLTNARNNTILGVNESCNNCLSNDVHISESISG